MAKKIFLSPSNQFNNAYAYGGTTEGVQCGKIASALETALKRCGFETRLLHDYDMSVKVANADKWGADLYIPIHSNACNKSVSGTRMFCYNATGNGYKACKAIYNYLAPLTPGKSENIKADPTLYEVRMPSAPTAYIEVDFHDVSSVAKWIVEHITDIAEAICKGVCDYFGVKYVAPAAPKPATPAATTGNTLYRVQVGAYSVKANAEAKLKEVQKYFPDAFIAEGKK